jgi:hypothetical protein
MPSHHMSGAEFRAFQAGRPDHERWELIGGVAMMMAPSMIAHNHIVTNLRRVVCTENLIRVDDVMESLKLAE